MLKSRLQPLMADLRSVGLADCEIETFLCLAEHKCLTLREISQKAHQTVKITGIALGMLNERRLIKARSDGKYQLEEEVNIVGWFSDQKGRIGATYDNAWVQVKAYLEECRSHSWKPEITYYEGIEGIKEIYEDIFVTLAAKRGKKVVYCWTDFEAKADLLGPSFIADYGERRKAAGIVIQAIKPKTAKAIRDQATAQRKSIVRLIRGLQLPGEVRIYGHKVAFITFAKDRPVGFVIEGEKIQTMMTSIFSECWKQAS